MDVTPYTIDYYFDGTLHQATVKPCCDENNVVDYMIYINGLLAFTIAKLAANNGWVVALKNADEHIHSNIIRIIGAAIDRHNGVTA